MNNSCFTALAYVSIYLGAGVYSSSLFAGGYFDNTSGNMLTASLLTEVGTDDNFLNTNSNKQSTVYYTLKPNFFVQTQFGRNALKLNALSSHVRYSKFSQDNHSDMNLLSSYRFKFADNKTLIMKAERNDVYESRGTGLTLGAADTLSTGDKKLTNLLVLADKLL